MRCEPKLGVRNSDQTFRALCTFCFYCICICATLLRRWRPSKTLDSSNSNPQPLKEASVGRVSHKEAPPVVLYVQRFAGEDCGTGRTHCSIGFWRWKATEKKKGCNRLFRNYKLFENIFWPRAFFLFKPSSLSVPFLFCFTSLKCWTGVLWTHTGLSLCNMLVLATCSARLQEQII